MAAITPNFKDGKIISYKFRACVGRNGNGKQIFRCTTWQVPRGLTTNKADKAARKAAEEWEQLAREEVQIQVRGRCRNDLDRLYVLSHDALIVPPEYLDRKLFKADKRKLCDILLVGFCVALCIAMSLLGLRTIVAQWYQYLGYIGMTVCIVPPVIIWSVLRSRGVVPRVYKKK